MPVAAITPALGSLIGSGATAASSLVGAGLQSHANSNALAFQKQQAEATWQQNETDRKANYDQWAAREARLGSIGASLGYGTRTIPAYVPGVDPMLTTSPIRGGVSGTPIAGSLPTYAPGTGANGVTPAPSFSTPSTPSIGATLAGQSPMAVPPAPGVTAPPPSPVSIGAMLQAAPPRQTTPDPYSIGTSLLPQGYL